MAAALLPASELARIHRLEIVARIIVEGLMAGAHRSPFTGSSIDFADHRPYVPGDDLRHLDWKVLARSDRLVLKRYEAETDLACVLAVDGSASMGYGGARAGISKYRYAAQLAAALAWLVLQQQDRVGLTLWSERAVQEVPARFQGQLERLCRALEAHEPSGRTDAAKGWERLAAPATARGLIIVLSDFLGDLEQFAHACDRLQARGHDLALVWILDPDECDLALPGSCRFQGLEGEGELIAVPRALAEAYRQEVERHRHALLALCRRRGAACIACRSDEPPHLPLNRLLVELDRRRRRQ
ncbi:MAG: DUF58 domain-containing protein [Planctomycetota bacterium]|nr:DUF58 domain-containing protein [Planctomycetota bacterium]MDW8373561.1 DUF58 domain-containing protein [Planctomycetota bacterium]